jgi:aerobic-type carbon monoxide dehydrogenase small subunit (CoxS/CutS family)
MNKANISITVNGVNHLLNVPPATRLLDILRSELKLTGAKEGCGEGECGACLVFVDDVLSNSCLIPIAQLNNQSITTIEGMHSDPRFQEIETAFVENGAAQCGFCTPGVVMATFDLLNTNSQPSTDDIKIALAGNICRCTGYTKITKSIIEAIKRIKVTK